MPQERPAGAQSFSQLSVPKAVGCSSFQLTSAMAADAAAEMPVKHIFTPMVIHLSDPVWDWGHFALEGSNIILHTKFAVGLK